jgi:hypothetical protein
MKGIARNLVLMAGFAMALNGLSLAQEDTYHVTANIPFDFYAGSQQLPAGVYRFEVNYGDHSVTLRNKATGRSYELLARPADGEGFGEAVVEFDVVGDTHMLADLKTASAGVGFPEQKALLTSAERRGSVAIVAALR